MLKFILIVLLTTISSTIEDADRSLGFLDHQKKSFAALVFLSNDNYIVTPDSNITCQWLQRLKYQSKLCRKPRGLAEALWRAKELAVHYCKKKFEYEQWNCSVKGIFFKKLYRETAFMHSIASSAVMYAIATACSQGTLGGCSCGSRGKPSSSFVWGGCGDNLKYAKRFARKFFQLKKKGDFVNSIVKHNIETGIKVVMQKEKRDCKCHGVSATCTMKICWKKVEPFDVVTNELKSLYFSARPVKPTNNIKMHKYKKNPKTLLYLEKDMSFCPMTMDRVCRDRENCATLCCGRGNYTTVMTVLVKQYEWCNSKKEYEVCYNTYEKNQTIYKCK